MAAHKTPDTHENAGLGAGNVIRMDVARASRFSCELGTLQDELFSLSTIARNFPSNAVGEGSMSPELVVRAFTKSMNERMYLLWDMVNYQEAAEQEGE